MISNEDNKLNGIKRKLYINAIFIIVTIIIGLYFFFLLYNRSLKQEKEILLYSDLLTKKVLQLKRVKKNLRSSYLADKFWHKINQKQNLNSQGLNFDQASFIFTDSIVKNNIYNQSTITSTKEQNLSNVQFTTQKTIVGSNIAIDLYCVSDSQVYNFINDIEENLPGFLKITSIEINLLDKDIQEVINNLYKNKIEILINAKIKAEWYDFKPAQNN